MADSKITSLKIILWIVAVYHIALGFLGIFSKNLAIALANSFFNFNLALTDQIYWVINPFAAYVLSFGVFMALAALNPKKYKSVIYAGLTLIAVRVVQRMVFFVSAPEGLIQNVNPKSNIIMILAVSAIGITILILVRKI